MRYKSIILIVIALFFSVFAWAEATCVDENSIPLTRPDDPNQPTLVDVGIYTFDIESISDIDENFNIDFIVTLRWKDPRLINNPDDSEPTVLCRYDVNNVWHPQMNLFNIRNVKKHLEEVVNVSSNGEVRYSQRIVGTLSSPLDLRLFPFDKQTLPIKSISFQYGPDKLKLILNDKRIGRANQFSINNWTIDNGQGEVKVFYPQSSKDMAVVGKLAMIDYQYHAKRYINYYIWKVFVPIILIILMSWAGFWIKGNQINVRVGLSATTILTMIAYLFSLRALLPEVSYLTLIDIFIFTCLVFVFAAFIETISVCSLHLKDKSKRGEAIDRTARKVFPAAFFSMLCIFAYLIYSL